MVKKISGILALLLLCLSLITLVGCQSSQESDDQDTGTVIEEEAVETSDGSDSETNSDTSTSTASNETDSKSDGSADDVVKVVMEVNGGQKVEMELYPDIAPKTVDNFVKLVNEGFYDGLTFHRVISDFMIQGGDPTGTGMGGSDETIVGEFSSNGYENNLSHKRGVVSMARSQDPDSASSQFFITVADSTSLDGDYAAFGKVTSGMDQVDKIAQVETNADDKPLQDQVIEKMYVVK